MPISGSRSLTLLALFVVSVLLLNALATFRLLSPFFIRWLRLPSKPLAEPIPYIGSTLLGSEQRQVAAGDLSLTAGQCDEAFPLHQDALRPAPRWVSSVGNVSRGMLDFDAYGSRARVIIKDGHIYVKAMKARDSSHTLAILHSLHQAVASAPEEVADTEFLISTTDMAPPRFPAMLAMTKQRGEAAWLLPDFGFFSWPAREIGAWPIFLDHAAKVNRDLSFGDKIGKLFWRGTLYIPLRDQLVAIAKQHPLWADVRPIVWWFKKAERPVHISEHCRYAYLAATEGFEGGYSGRLKYLLSCGSVVVSHDLHWDQHFHVALDGIDGSPTQNIVFTDGPGFNGLEDTMARLLADPKRSAVIANNAYKTFHDRYLTPAAIACYWRSLLAEYTQHLLYEPTLDGTEKDVESVFLINSAEWGTPHM